MTIFGRDAELRVWEQLRDSATAGTGAVWLISGISGIGKTTLVRHLIREVRDAGWQTWTATGNPAGGVAESWGVLRQWLTRLVTATERDHEPFDGPGVAIHDLINAKNTNPSSLSFALSWVAQSVAVHQPLLIVLDDAHWADSTSLTAIAEAATYIAEQPVVIVITHRPQHSIAPIEAIATRPFVTQSSLNRMDRAQISAILNQPTPDADHRHGVLNEDELSRVAAVSGGLPLLVAYLAQYPHELAHLASVAQDSPLAQMHSSTELIAKLRERLDQTSELIPLIGATAILGPDARTRTLAAVVDLPRVAVQRAIDQALHAELLHEHDGIIECVHPLIAEAALSYAEVTQSLYSRAAIVLHRAGAQIERVGSLLIASEPTSDPQVVELLIEAAQRAVTIGELQTARKLIDRAWLEDALDPGIERELLVIEARIFATLGHTDDAVRTWTRARDLFVDADPRKTALLVDIGDAHYGAGSIDEAKQAFEAALQELASPAGSLYAGARTEESERRLLLARLAAVGWLVGDAKQLGDTQIAAIRSSDPRLDGYGERALLSHAALEMTILGHDAALTGELARRAARDLLIVAEDGIEGPVLSMLTGALNGAEQDREALAVMDAALKMARTNGSISAFATMSYCRSYVHMNRGRLQRARLDVEAALRAHRDHGWVVYAVAAQMVMVRVALAQGDVATAVSIGEQTDWDGPGSTAPPLVQMMTLHLRGMLARSRGADREAFALLSSASDIAKEVCPGPTYAAATHEFIKTAAALGHHDVAYQTGVDQVLRAREFGAPRTLGRALLAAAAAAEGDDRIAKITEALALLGKNEGRLEYADGLVMLAESLVDTRVSLSPGLSSTLADLGIHDASAAHLANEGLVLAERIGAETVAGQARALLGRIGLPSGRTSTSPNTPRLTASELRVCELAAQGLTNRQIAAELFVTIKAVEWHLWRAYPKLQIKSRRELADLIPMLSSE